jgi:hypothetical protein
LHAVGVEQWLLILLLLPLLLLLQVLQGPPRLAGTQQAGQTHPLGTLQA